MKIIFVAPRFHTNQYEVIKTLKSKGFDVEFHVNYLGYTEDHSILTPILYSPCKASRWLEETFGIGGGDRPRLFPNPIIYFRDLAQSNADIIIIRNPNRYFSIIAAICSRILDIKIIFYTQTEINRKYSLIKRLAFCLAVNVFNAAWYSPLKSDHGNNKSFQKNIYYIPFAVPQGNTSNFNNKKEKYSNLLMIGKYEDRKNHILLVEALYKLKDKYKFKATIIGECIHEEQLEKFKIIKTRINELGMDKLIVLEKNIPFSKMKSIYQTHDIYVLPSRDEPAAISILEAMAHGLPSICSDTCGTKSYIKPGKNGDIFKTDNLSDLTNKIELLIKDPKHLDVMKNCCLSNYEDQYSGEAYYKHFTYLLEDKWNLKIK